MNGITCVWCLHLGTFNLFNTFRFFPGFINSFSLLLSQLGIIQVLERRKKNNRKNWVDKHKTLRVHRTSKIKVSSELKRDVYVLSQHKLQCYYRIALTAASIDTFFLSLDSLRNPSMNTEKKIETNENC